MEKPMQSVIETGKTVEEAVEKALKQLNADESEVKVEILDDGSKNGGGLFGLFKKKEISVRVIKQSKFERIEEIAKTLLNHMGFTAQVSVHELENEMINVKLETMGSDGLLIGRNGITLSSLQHVINRIANVNGDLDEQIVIDVGDYRERRDGQLQLRAKELAKKVKIRKKQIVMEPLHATDRRIIHLTLSKDPDVRTYTIGEGATRRVVLAPNIRKQINKEKGAN